MTRLNKKAFKILLTTSIITVAAIIVNAIIFVVTLDDFIASMLEIYAEAGVPVDEAFETLLRVSIIAGIILGLGLALSYQGLMLYFMISHNNKPRKGRYLTVMFVLNIIALVVLPCSLIFVLFDFDAFTFISLVFSTVVIIIEIVGIRLQHNVPRPPHDEPQIPVSPYDI